MSDKSWNESMSERLSETESERSERLYGEGRQDGENAGATDKFAHNILGSGEPSYDKGFHDEVYGDEDDD